MQKQQKADFILELCVVWIVQRTKRKQGTKS